MKKLLLISNPSVLGKNLENILKSKIIIPILFHRTKTNRQHTI